MSDLIFHAGAECYSLYGSLSKRTSEEEDVAETFTRAAEANAGYYVDRAGVLKQAETNVLRTEWTGASFDTPNLLLEDARTNVALWNRDLTNAVWTATTCTVARDQTGADGAASSASSLTATAGNATVLQSITLSSSARYQSAYVKRITGSGTIQMTMDNGSTWTAVTVTSDWTRVNIPTQTLANPTVGFRVVTNADAIAVDFVQNENGAFQSSPIAVTTVAVTRASETLSFPFVAPPQEMTVFVKFTERGTIDSSADDRVVQIGKNDDTAPRLILYNDNATTKYRVYHQAAVGGANVRSTAAANPSIGDTVELRGVMGADGSVFLGQSINSAAEAVATTSAALTPAAAWSGQLVNVNSVGTTLVGHNAFQSIKIARGTKTLAEMRILGV